MKNSAHSLFGCGWDTASMRAGELAGLRERVLAGHPGLPAVTSCQRLEVFGATPCGCDAPLRWSGIDAVRRIAEVAAGLHSAVLGEEQVMGQVRTAFASAPPEIRRHVSLAIAAARELRRSNRIDSHAGHLLDRGLKLAGISPSGGLLVLGAGSMGRLVASRGIALGFSPVLIAGRREPESALPDGAVFCRLSDLNTLDEMTVVAGCLGSGSGEIALGEVPPTRLLLDLGTPRNFAPAEGVLTIADLLREEASHPHTNRRRAELREELARILDRRLGAASADSGAPLGALRLSVERTRLSQLRRLQRLHPELDPAAVDALTRSLLDQVFHNPTARLHERGDDAFTAEVAALFSDV